MKVFEVTKTKKQVNEALPAAIPLIIAGARAATPWLMRQGAKMIAGAGRGTMTGVRAAPSAIGQVGTGIGRAGTGIGVAAGGLAVNQLVNMVDEDIIPLIQQFFGSEVVQKILRFAGKYGLPILAVLAILYGGQKIISALIRKDQEEKTESKDQVKGNEPMPKKKKGRTQHPFHGRLVGEENLSELGREEKSKTSNNIFMRFGLKKPIAAAGGDNKPYIVGYAGFANTPADLKHAEAKWKFYNLTKKEDFVNAVKKMISDKTFTAASGVTLYIDNASLLKKYPEFGEFIEMIGRMGGEKIRVEYKPNPEDNDSEKGSGKKRVKAKWANPRDEYDTPEKQTTRYFTITSPTMMNQLRRNDRVMQYYRPNRNAFVMGPREFDAFVKTFGRDNIKIVDRFKEEFDETATAGGMGAGSVGSVPAAVGSIKKKKKTNLIKR